MHVNMSKHVENSSGHDISTTHKKLPKAYASFSRKGGKVLHCLWKPRNAHECVWESKLGTLMRKQMQPNRKRGIPTEPPATTACAGCNRTQGQGGWVTQKEIMLKPVHEMPYTDLNTIQGIQKQAPREQVQNYLGIE